MKMNIWEKEESINDTIIVFNDNNEFAPFKNIITEWYSKDISKKIKFTYRNMQKAGRIPGGDVPLYGSMYDNDRNRFAYAGFYGC